MGPDLTPFGFPPTESLVYRTLLRLGPATGYAVARAARLARANAYGALDGLVTRGAAARLPGRPARYRPADPPALLAQIAAAHGEALDRLSSALADAARSSEPDTKTLAGARAVANVVLQLVARAELRGGQGLAARPRAPADPAMPRPSAPGAPCAPATPRPRARSLPRRHRLQRALRPRRRDPDQLHRRRNRPARRIPARPRRLALHLAPHPAADHAGGVPRHCVRQPRLRGVGEAAHRIPQRRLRAARDRLAGLASHSGCRAGGTLDGGRDRRRGSDPRPAARPRPRAHRRGRTRRPRTPAVQGGPLARARPPDGVVPRPQPHRATPPVHLRRSREDHARGRRSVLRLGCGPFLRRRAAGGAARVRLQRPGRSPRADPGRDAPHLGGRGQLGSP